MSTVSGSQCEIANGAVPTTSVAGSCRRDAARRSARGPSSASVCVPAGEARLRGSASTSCPPRATARRPPAPRARQRERRPSPGARRRSATARCVSAASCRSVRLTDQRGRRRRRCVRVASVALITDPVRAVRQAFGREARTTASPAACSCSKSVASAVPAAFSSSAVTCAGDAERVGDRRRGPVDAVDAVRRQPASAVSGQRLERRSRACRRRAARRARRPSST